MADSARSQRRTKLVVVPASILVTLGGGYLLYLGLTGPGGVGSHDFLLGAILAAMGLGFLSIALFVTPILVVEVTISDSSVQLLLASGKTRSFEWSDPSLKIRISWAIRDPANQPLSDQDRIFDSALLTAVVTQEIADAVLTRARLLGLVVDQAEVPFSLRGPPFTYERLTISHQPFPSKV